MIRVQPIPAFDDNYIWMLREEDGNQAWVVDPGDAQPVRETLKEQGLTLEGILITHHHWDHTGGIGKLLRDAEVPVLGPDNPQIKEITQPLREGDRITVLNTQFEVLETPGHTLDHIVFFAAAHEPPLLFCGDTLFAGGCGRLFEGTPGQMHASLGKLRVLPGETKIYCTHEYTLANLAFAQAVEPDNTDIAQRIQSAEALRESGTPTVPTNLSLEWKTNPFLRVDEPAVQAMASAQADAPPSTPEATFAAIRAWKDRF